MLAAIRPDSWNLPLFLHVLGATLTFGAAATVALVAFANRGREPDRAQWLRRLAFRVALFGLLPAYVLMRATAQWINNKEYPHGHEPGWVGVGFIVTDAGALLILVLLILAGVGARRPGFRAAAAVPWLASVYLIALAVAWFAMSAKPGGSG